MWIQHAFICLLCITFSVAADKQFPTGPITKHFSDWLINNGYGKYKFDSTQFQNLGSYGGKTSDDQKLAYTPIMFVHGNEDGALFMAGNTTSGSSHQIAYFEQQGYTSAELYVTTWGHRRPDMAMLNDHNCRTILRLRRFAEAIMRYTNSKFISVISHSMGVTIARKIVKGGILRHSDGTFCDVGPPMTNIVRTFIGLSGANYGMCACMGFFAATPTCNPQNGFFPGDSCGSNMFTCSARKYPSPCVKATYADLLYEMNMDNIREGHKVYSFWSIEDDIIMNADNVWGRPTSFIPCSEVLVFRDLTHMQVKERTVQTQYAIIALDHDFVDARNSTPFPWLLIGVFYALLIFRIVIFFYSPQRVQF